MAKILAITILILSVTAASTAVLIWRDYTSPGGLAVDTNVVLPSGSGFSKSVDILAETGVIAHPSFFKLVAYLTGAALHVKAGEYHFTADISPEAVMRIIVSGAVVVHKVTIAEGLNVREVVAILNADPVLTGIVPENIPEGSLFPETYHFNYGDSKASIIKRMQDKMEKTLSELWEKRADNLPFSSKEQALVMASIVEKETGLAAERARVAAVFVNRLKQAMRLQSDPTVTYGIEKATGKALGRELMILDLKTPTPYNTYEIDGLPPTPITNPGRGAIEAALHPLESSELYFVATGSGGHNFAATLDEHNKNVREYRKTLEKK